MPCEGRVQLADFTEKYSKDGAESTVRVLTESLLFPIWSIKKYCILNMLAFEVQTTLSIKISPTGTERTLSNFICHSPVHILSYIIVPT